jgi:hypothetical protein
MSGLRLGLNPIALFLLTSLWLLAVAVVAETGVAAAVLAVIEHP